MLQATLNKFGYPDSLVKSYQYWHLLLRPGQPTLGCLILICKESVEQYSAISAAAAAEQATIIIEVEKVLKKRFSYNKINYLMLMMVDPAVHFHIIPRYELPVVFCDQEFADCQWPNPPSLGNDLMLTAELRLGLLQTLKMDFLDKG